MEENFDRHIAEKINRTQQSADTRPGSRPNNMVPNDKNFRSNTNTKRRNLVLLMKRSSLILNSLQKCQELCCLLWRLRLLNVRLNRRDEKDVCPGPVIATCSRIFHRDSIITKKRALRNIPALSQVFINADETLQVRRAKAILRRAAFIAPGDGEEVEDF